MSLVAGGGNSRSASMCARVLVLVLAGGACSSDPPAPPPKLFHEVRPAVSPPTSAANGRAGGGFAVFDYDQDGNSDLAVATGYSLTNLLGAGGVPPAPQVVLQGDGSGHFEDVSTSVGLSLDAAAVTMLAADLDNDGDTDLLLPEADPSDGEVGAPAPVHLYESQGALGFVDRGVLDPTEIGTTYSICAADFDRDGDLDLFLANHSDTDGLKFDGDGYAIGQLDRFYRNDGNLQFTDVTASTGTVGAVVAWTNTCMAHDYDGDGDLDLWVAYENYPSGVTLYRNDGDFHFVDVSDAVLGEARNRVGNWMGFAAGDYDGDLDVDVFVTNMGIGSYLVGGTSLTRRPNGYVLHMLLENQGDGTYRDVAPDISIESPRERVEPPVSYPPAVRGLAALEFGWSAWFVDYDADGDEDLYFSGGWAFSAIAQIIGTIHTGANEGRLLESSGRGAFREVSQQVGLLNVDDTGFLMNGWGNRFADLDRNGFPDLVLANQWFGDQRYPGGIRVWLNQGNENGWLKVDLQGRASGPYGYGARIELTTSTGVQVRERIASASISGQDIEPVYFGVGHSEPERLVVRWPSGIVSEVNRPKIRETIAIIEE